MLCYPVWAQTTLQPTYNYTLPNKWETWTLAPGGVLLVGHSKGFTAIEAHKSQLLYDYTELGKIKPEEMEIVDGLPWVILHQGGFKAATNSKKVVLDYFTGKPIFESAKFDWTAASASHILPEKGIIVIMGINKRSTYALGIYSLEENKELAFFDLKDKKLNGGFPFYEKVKIVQDRIFVPMQKALACIHIPTLKMEWFTNKINGMTDYNYLVDEAGKSVYVFSPFLKASIYKIDAANGSLKWPKPISLKGAVKRLELIKEGLWCYSEEEKSFDVDLFDPGTGQKLWKKPYSDKGGIRQFIFRDDGVVFGTSTGEVNILQHNGTLKFAKNIDTGAGYRVFATNEQGNLFYLTMNKMGVINLNDGSFVKEPAKFRKVEQMVTGYDEKNSKFVVSTGNELFFITPSGESKKVCDLEFKGGEMPQKIEFREGGILLSSNQNAMLVDYDGNIKYQAFYKASGASLAAKLAAGALMVASTGMAAGNTAQAGMMQGANPMYKSDEQRRAESNAKAYGNIANSAAAVMSQRFSATAATKNSLYIQTSLDDGVGLIRMNKDTGKPDAQIVTKDKKPEYLVDEDFGVFYI